MSNYKTDAAVKLTSPKKFIQLGKQKKSRLFPVTRQGHFFFNPIYFSEISIDV